MSVLLYKFKLVLRAARLRIPRMFVKIHVGLCHYVSSLNIRLVILNAHLKPIHTFVYTMYIDLEKSIKCYLMMFIYMYLIYNDNFVWCNGYWPENIHSVYQSDICIVFPVHRGYFVLVITPPRPSTTKSASADT